MQKADKVINCNVCTLDKRNLNYQLIRTDIVHPESNAHLVFYSIIVNKIENSKVVESEYVEDICTEEEEAFRIFELISSCEVPVRLLKETVEEIVS